MIIDLLMVKFFLLGRQILIFRLFLKPYGCASYIVGYISTSQRGMRTQLDAAANEARKGYFDLKKQVRHNLASSRENLSSGFSTR